MMQAHEVMISQVYKVKRTDTIRSVIKQFIEKRISGLPVVNERNEIVGYVSDGDIMRYIGKHNDRIIDSFYWVTVINGDDVDFEKRLRELLDLNVMSIASKRVIKVSWDEEIETIASILGKKQIKKLPVERDGVLVGIISRGDVIRHSFKTIV
ncbi:CBS domain-containing protein [Desulfosporosinus sp. PR]|uniref:CBS domain-containing protein n=1 Tax=Candidatus Desulfosporosinus nitrosoreducens TaxID=3401928 RepID=UPI0027EF23CB|nr:CBS domain-containing protein [Desulfosporosinus sp. PR]MDQ7094041.1 CBS domain-containing protein [Desulfosporosinus sp. PR]